MSLIQTFTAMKPPIGPRLLRLSGCIAAFASVCRRIAGRRIVPGRREGHGILLAGFVIVLFIAAFAGLMLEELAESSRVSNEARVEHRANAVTHQIRTTVFMVEQALNQASDEIAAHEDPQRLMRLSSRNPVAGDLLANFLFLDSQGHVVSAMTQNQALLRRDLSNRDYFRVHLDNGGLESSVTPPIHGLLTGSELIPISRAVRRPNGELVGVLVAMIEVDALVQAWKNVGVRVGDAIELVGRDGTVWVRWPRQPVADGPVEGPSWSGRVTGWPTRVVARLEQATVDDQNFDARRAIVASAAGGSGMVILFCFLLAHRARQTARERDAGDVVRARLLAALNAVPVEFVEYDRDRRLIMANRAARNASPWSIPGAAGGKTINEVMESYTEHFKTEDTAEAWRDWGSQTIADFDRGGVAELRRPDGQWRRSYVTDMPGGGRVVVRVDITETKRRDEQLAAEMARLNSVFQSTGAGVLLLDRSARVILINQFLLDLLGKTAAEIVGQPYAGLSVAGLDPAVIAQWQAASGAQRLKTVEFERSLPSGGGAKRLIKVTANPIQDETGHLRYIVLIGVDDTERRASEIRLFNSARLAHLGEMATGMAHEINQPLAVIRMATESILEELDTPEAAGMPPAVGEFVKARLERICVQVDRTATLVRSLRAVARKPTGNPEPFDLVEAARVGGGLVREQLEAARITFSLDLPSTVPMVRGEANELQQVIMSLVLNARDAMVEDLDQPPMGTLGHIALRVAAGPASGATELVVEDDGPGIAAAALPRLFEPFFTTRPTGKGTGLGLSISHGVIKRMGGEITAENRAEGGARFRIVFPSA